MYVIDHGMGKKWKFLSYIFCIAGVIGLLAIFQANQLTAVIQAVLIQPETIGKVFGLTFFGGVIVAKIVVERPDRTVTSDWLRRTETGASTKGTG